MTLHYHGTPISPKAKLLALAGAHFCVSYERPADVVACHRIGQSVMLDNGAFSVWRRSIEPNWLGYYKFCERWLGGSTWAVIPDVIDGSAAEQHELLAAWPFGHRGAPVWHLHEPIDRALSLVDFWPRVCFGSSADYSRVLSSDWCRRMDAVWNEIAKRHRHTPWIHMLRGMQLCRREWPFASVDSTDIARNHNRGECPGVMGRRWDSEQCPLKWIVREELALT